MGLGLVFCFLTKTKEERDGRSRRAGHFASCGNRRILMQRREGDSHEQTQDT